MERINYTTPVTPGCLQGTFQHGSLAVKFFKTFTLEIRLVPAENVGPRHWPIWKNFGFFSPKLGTFGRITGISTVNEPRVRNTVVADSRKVHKRRAGWLRLPDE